jgi:hypothetical protein
VGSKFLSGNLEGRRGEGEEKGEKKKKRVEYEEEKKKI